VLADTCCGLFHFQPLMDRFQLFPVSSTAETPQGLWIVHRLAPALLGCLVLYGFGLLDQLCKISLRLPQLDGLAD
jgi:hypothetical protein